jgi:tyrosyl-tRNA synthetase
MTHAVEDLEPLIRRAEHVVRIEELEERLGLGRPLRVKLGVDPTTPDVTLGWAVPLRKLREFQEAGHTAVLILGDFTARIGDPSGKSQTRPQLSVEAVKEHARHCLDSLKAILSEDNLEVRYNSEWLEPLDFGDILRLTSHLTVAQMLEREDFSKRYKANRPISLVEFMYPVMQGYDSVAVRADVELGGTDQLFNLLVGRDLQRAFDQPAQVCLTLPLLEGLDGVQKMSQSLNNYISVREKPDVMFGQLMSIPDSLITRYGLLAADFDDATLGELGAAAAEGGPAAGAAKRRMAHRVVEMYHGPEEAEAAERAFDRQFKQHEPPEDVLEARAPKEAIKEGLLDLPIALASFGLTKSRSEARRLIAQGAVRVDGKRCDQEKILYDPLGEPPLVQVGRRRFVRITG